MIIQGSEVLGVTEVDWARLARPQKDGYDTRVIAYEAQRRGSLLRADPWLRRPTQGAPTVLFGGMVAVRNRKEGGLPYPRYVPAAPQHPNLNSAEDILHCWPEASEQFPLLVDTIEVWTDSHVEDDVIEYTGFSSHSNEGEFGIIMLTVGHPLVIAEGMVHEMAHHKLRVLGISFLNASKMIVNDPSELYVSPIITSTKRPMTAVFHAQYSFIHVTSLNLSVYARSPADSELRRQALRRLARYVPRMETGHVEIARHLQTDELGKIFCGAFMDWSAEVISLGKKILDRELN